MHKPAPVDNTKELADTYEAIQKQIKNLPSSDKKPKKQKKVPVATNKELEELYQSRLN